MSEWLAKVLARAEAIDASEERGLIPDRDFESYLEVQRRETERRRQAFTGETPYQHLQAIRDDEDESVLNGDNPGPRISHWMPKWPQAIPVGRLGIDRDDEEEMVVPLPPSWKPSYMWDELHQWDRAARAPIPDATAHVSLEFDLIIDDRGWKNFQEEFERLLAEMYASYGVPREDIKGIRLVGGQRASAKQRRAIRAAMGWANPRSGLTEVVPPPDEKPAETRRRMNAEMRRTVEPGKRKAHWLK